MDIHLIYLSGYLGSAYLVRYCGTCLPAILQHEGASTVLRISSCILFSCLAGLDPALRQQPLLGT